MTTLKSNTYQFRVKNTVILSDKMVFASNHNGSKVCSLFSLITSIIIGFADFLMLEFSRIASRRLITLFGGFQIRVPLGKCDSMVASDTEEGLFLNKETGQDRLF